MRVLRRLFDDHRREFSDQKIRDHAKADAESGLPLPDSHEPSPFELQLQHAASTLASKVASTFKSSLELLDAKIKAEEELLHRKHKDALAAIEANYSVETDACENSFGLSEAHRAYSVAEQRFNQQYERFGRAPVVYVPHWLYLVFAFLIFVGEIPLNALVFQIFGENQVMTWIMAFIIGLSVPLVAHFIGIKLREHEGTVSWPNALKALAAFAVVTIALYGLSVMRQTYLGEFKEDLGLTDTLVESSFLFFWLNLAVFSAAIVVSYLAHDTVPGFQEAEHLHSKNRKKIEAAERRRVQTLVRLGQKKIAETHRANRDFQDGLVEVILLKGMYDQVLKEGEELERQCLHRLQQNLAVYRHENLRYRNGETTIQSISANLDFPLKLEKMKEKLINDSQSEVSHDNRV